MGYVTLEVTHTISALLSKKDRRLRKKDVRTTFAAALHSLLKRYRF